MTVASDLHDAVRHAAVSAARSPVLVLGSPPPRALAAFREAAQLAFLNAHVEAIPAHADAWLAANHPSAVIVHASPVAEEACLRIRRDPARANVPLLCVADTVTDLSFEEIFGWGADDLTSFDDPFRLARRLRAIARAGEVPLSRRRGICVVADPDARRRVLVGRALRNSGWGVNFAVDGDDALAQAGAPGVELVVASSRLDLDDEVPLAKRARAAGIAVPFVIAAPPRSLGRCQAAVAGTPNVAVYDAFGPPENVLFVANDLLSRGARPNQRESPRVLYGGCVSFRQAGSDDDEIGYAYNISAGGVYVRTLAPPTRGSDVWIELRPPRCDRRVRIEGQVVWTRAFGPNDVATIPPGFGVKVTGGSVGDLERWVRGYRSFAAEIERS